MMFIANICALFVIYLFISFMKIWAVMKIANISIFHRLLSFLYISIYLLIFFSVSAFITLQVWILYFEFFAWTLMSPANICSSFLINSVSQNVSGYQCHIVMSFLVTIIPAWIFNISDKSIELLLSCPLFT